MRRESDGKSRLLISQLSLFFQQMGIQQENQKNLQKLQSELQKMVIKNIEDLKDRIQTLFVERKEGWLKYLDPSGNGLIHYLREIAQMTLQGI